MESLDLNPEDDDLTVEVSLTSLHRAIGKQGILNEDEENPEYFYMAALALECSQDDDYPIDATVMEFIRNCEALDVSQEAADDIEKLIR